MLFRSGVTKSRDGYSFVLADLPGLIENASLGEGLGDKFLRHIERTKVIAHVIDMGSTEGRDPYEDFPLINKELENFNSKLMKKPMIVIANKMDVVGEEENLIQFSKKVQDIEIFPVSAASSQGLLEVIDALATILKDRPEEELFTDDEIESHVLYQFQREEPYTIHFEDGVFVIRGEKIEKLFKMTKFSSEEGAKRFARKLTKMGIDDKLEEMGAKEGDQVRILDFYFDYRQ